MVVLAGLCTIASLILRPEDFAAKSADPMAKMECPAILDLGQREEGEQIAKQFVIGNLGDGELIITNIRTSCSCTGLEYENNGNYVRPNKLQIPGHSERKVAMRVSVRGQPGATIRNRVEFDTNDPEKTTYSIEAVISNMRGGVRAVPTGVIIGTLHIGESSRSVLDIIDDAITPRSIENVSSSDPEHVLVRLLPPEKPGKAAPAHGIVIAQVEVIVRGDFPGKVDETVIFQINGEPTNLKHIPVTGQVVREIEVQPSSLILPRRSPKGLIYSGDCVCRETAKKQISLRAISSPAGLSVELLPVGADLSEQIVRITWDPKTKENAPDDSSKSVRLCATCDGQEHFFDIRVVCEQGSRQ